MRTSKAHLVARWAPPLAAVFALLLASSLVPSVDWRGGWSLAIRLGPVVGWVLVPFAVQLAFDTYGWSLLLRRLDRSVPFGTLFQIRLATEAVLLSLSGGAVLGETLKPFLLKKRAGVPLGETVATVAVRKALLVTSEGVYLVLAACAVAVMLPRDALGLPWAAVWVGAMALVLLLAGGTGLALLGRGAVAERAHRWFSRLPFARLRSWLEPLRARFQETDAHLGRSSAQTGGALAAYLGVWLTEAVETYLILRLLGAELPFATVLGVEAVLSLVRSMAFFVPAGLGVQDAGYLAVLHGLSVPGAGVMGPAFVLLKRMKELVWVGVGYALLVWTSGTPRAIAAEAASGG